MIKLAMGVTAEMTGSVTMGQSAWYAVCVSSRFAAPQMTTA